MKRILTTLTLLLAVAATTLAQQGLQVQQVFQKYGHEKGCKMVEMNDGRLRGFRLQRYVSLTYRNLADKIEPMLEGDRRAARKIREVVNDGRVQSGYYMMAPLSDGVNRYVLFSKQANNSGAVIYIEGKLSPDDIITLCYSRRP